jgi:hypothetical protein
MLSMLAQVLQVWMYSVARVGMEMYTVSAAMLTRSSIHLRCIVFDERRNSAAVSFLTVTTFVEAAILCDAVRRCISGTSAVSGDASGHADVAVRHQLADCKVHDAQAAHEACEAPCRGVPSVGPAAVHGWIAADDDQHRNESAALLKYISGTHTTSFPRSVLIAWYMFTTIGNQWLLLLSRAVCT